MSSFTFLAVLFLFSVRTFSFLSPTPPFKVRNTNSAITIQNPLFPKSQLPATPDGLDYNIISLVLGQETYGLAIVCVGESLYSLSQAPTLGYSLRVLGPTAVAALVLAIGAGPLVTSAEATSITTGLFLATAVSIGLGLHYTLRLTSPVSPSPKEIAALGFLVSLAGFFSFTQNLLVDGFVTLPTLPELPHLDL
jgi:hypothetical protein